jgi:hypothetical protein
MKNDLVIKRFGESLETPPNRQWYELSSGKIFDCDESTINILWCHWVASGNSRRADTSTETVFEFIEPIHINLLTAESWG